MNDTNELRGINFEEGYIAVIDKPLRWTSADVVRKVKFTLRKAGYRKIKVGHAGTLDPLATGILLLCIGRATKMADALQAEGEGVCRRRHARRHDPELRPRTRDRPHLPLGAHHARGRRQGARRAHRRAAAGASGLLGQEDRGARAYELARAGEEVALRKSLITIYEMRVEEYDLPRVRIRVRCSKGTYIRSLAREIGEALGSGAHLTSLRRTRSGGFTLANAWDLEDFLKNLQNLETK